MKKYELTAEEKTLPNGKTLRRIRALRTFIATGGREVHEGDLGGWVGGEHNLEHHGNCWVVDNACVCGNARVSDNACVYGNARVSGDAQIPNNKGILWISKIGSRNDTVTFFVTEAGIGVVCGCFSGTLEEFAAAVEKTHGDNEHGQAYRLAIELAKLRIKLPEAERTERSHA